MKRLLYDFLVENNFEVLEGTIQLGDKELRFEVTQKIGGKSVEVPPRVEKLENMYSNLRIYRVDVEYPETAEYIGQVVPKILANRFSVFAKGNLL